MSPVRGLALGEPSKVWRNVAHPALLNRHRDRNWMVAHEILPVRAVMHSRGMGTTARCPWPTCGGEETVRHLLWECRAARDLWIQAGPLLTPSLPAGEVLTAQLVPSHTIGKIPPALAHPDMLQGGTLDLQKPAGGEARGDGHPGSGDTGYRDPRVVRHTRQSDRKSVV